MNLDFIYYPVSFILWCWHWVFGLVLGDSTTGNAISWTLSIVFLVFTLRLILLRPAVQQVRAMRKMQKFQPEIKKLQKKYAGDKQRLAQEMQKLQREQGFNPLSGCLPILLQFPVFIGLNHVLRSFHFGIANYFIPIADVNSYVHASLFGVQLNDAIFGTSYTGIAAGFHWEVAPVAIPLMIIASIATHFTARLSVQRQEAMGQTSTNPQAAMMNKLMLWIFPLGVLVFGAALQVGLLLYWLSNNIWTLGQQHFVMKRMDREDEHKQAVAVEKSQALAPRPGQKPVQPKNRRPAAGAAGAAGTAGKPATTTTKPAATKQAGTGAKQAAAGKSAATAKPASAADATNRPAGRGTSKGGAAKGTAKGTTKGTSSSRGATNGRPRGDTEIPGLISDRSQRKKQDRKRG
ncbi:MAG TPA: membrane protein insertase YidC [Pseudonocardiaceae bacterium]